MSTVETSLFNSLIVVSFFNTAIHADGAFVCVDQETAKEEIRKLEKLPHIHSITVVDAVVKGNK